MLHANGAYPSATSPVTVSLGAPVLNASLPMLEIGKESGPFAGESNTISTKSGQFLNAAFPIEVMPLPNSTFSNVGQSAKASFPIVVTLSPILASSNLSAPLNTLSLIVVIWLPSSITR